MEKRSYRITSPRKCGNTMTVDVIEYKGSSIIKRTTIREEQAKPFINAVFRIKAEPKIEMDRSEGTLEIETNIYSIRK